MFCKGNFLRLISIQDSGLVKDIDKGTIVDGSDLRTRLINAGYNSDYIKSTTNTNNK